MKKCHRTALWRAAAALVAVLLAAPIVRGADVLTTLHYFGTNNTGGKPSSVLVQASDGNFYGTTSEGGTNDDGAIFRITPKGQLTPLYSFTGGADGANPFGTLVIGPDGDLYGTTAAGGQHYSAENPFGSGTIFKFTLSGVLTPLYSFTDGVDGANPYAGLTAGTDGNFYGTTSDGGTNGLGTIFKYTSQGVFVPLYSFTNGLLGGDYAPLVAGTDGNLYGTAAFGGEMYYGTVFKITTSGSLTVLFTFTNGPEGSYPYGGLTLGPDGTFYGTTTEGGAYQFYGTVFNITPSGALTTLYSFTGNADGANPEDGLQVVVDSATNFYGTTLSAGTNGFGTLFSISSSGTFKAYYSFTNGFDGAQPQAGVVLGTDANLYGMTLTGGTNGFGTVYEMTQSGTVTALASFDGDPDGSYPYGGLALGSDGDFYGTTYIGGGTNSVGTAFKISSSGTLTVLHSFTNYIGGNYPSAGLVQGTDGNFYGTVYAGGSHGYGTVFRMTPSGTVSNLASFTLLDGASPSAALVQGSDSNFYGTTVSGGPRYGGTIFRVSPSGTFSNLFNFGNDTNGANPYGALTLGFDGNFYGTTYAAGSNSLGTVFKFTPSGTLTTLHAFSGQLDGANPRGGLVQGTDTNLYGTTYQGGANGNGTVFKITPVGAFTLLHSFTGADGNWPAASMIQASDGNFYGTTYNGGLNNNGTVFSITPKSTLTTVHFFTGGADGENPIGGLVQGKDGNLYGTTSGIGGAKTQDGLIPNNTCEGTIFRLTLSAAPPQSSLALTNTVILPGGGIQFDLNTTPGTTYAVQYNPVLSYSGWTDLLTTNATTNVVTFVSGPKPGFYRAVQQ